MDHAAIAAKTDERILENFITENQRFILICAAKAARRFVTKSDDEWSAALLAFHEAVGAYDAGKGSFRSFAALIIRRRVTDFLRGEMRHSSEIPVEPYTMTGELTEESPSPLQVRIRDQVTKMAEDAAETGSAAEEIGAMQQILSAYGFSFFDLSDSSPKAEKTRRQCALAVRTLIEDTALISRMQASKALPIRELALRSGVSKKLLERHRKYIIAAAEILTGDYPVLGEYLRPIRKAVT